MAGVGLGQQEQQRAQQARDINRKYDRLVEQERAKTSLGKDQGGISKEAAAKNIADLNAQRQLALSSWQQTYAELDKARADWRNGIGSGIDDFTAQATNMA